jgi:hypothetical protein
MAAKERAMSSHEIAAAERNSAEDWFADKYGRRVDAPVPAEGLLLFIAMLQ